MAVCSNTAVRSGADYSRDFRDLGLGEFLDAYITSLDVGFRKPHAAMFEAGLRALRLAPEQAAMIGDRPERDIIGAKSIGMRTIWVRPPDFVGACEPTPDAEVISLAELAPILERWARG
jgi:putative hydrolase of the HAD superfamily